MKLFFGHDQHDIAECALGPREYMKPGVADHPLQHWLIEVVQVNGILEIVPEVSQCMSGPAVELRHGNQQQSACAEVGGIAGALASASTGGPVPGS